MARARNIKPALFVNDELAEVEPLGRLLFIGLWTIADREGRLKDRPKKIKAQTLPFDDCDIDDLLNQLEKHNFIYRYEAGGCSLIQILNFTRHQNPHMKEPDSELPPPDLHDTNTIQEQDLYDAKTADSLLLIPDTPIGADGKKQLTEKAANELFDKLWQLYPRKKGRGGVSKTQKGKLLNVGEDELTRCINRFIDDMEAQKRDIEKYPYGSTFFNGGYIDYLDENYDGNSNKSREVYL